MSDTKNIKQRGRPRKFNPQEALATAQKLFHARGYDAVSVADVTQALGINPPSFYSAYGSKAGLWGRILNHWAQTGAIPITQILVSDRPVPEALAALLEEAARRYAADQTASGCLVLEGTRCNDLAAREAAIAYNLSGERLIRDYVAERFPDEADEVADFVSTIMSGLSAKARNGYNLNRLLATVRIASRALRLAFPE